MKKSIWDLPSLNKTWQTVASLIKEDPTTEVNVLFYGHGDDIVVLKQDGEVVFATWFNRCWPSVDDKRPRERRENIRKKIEIVEDTPNYQYIHRSGNEEEWNRIMHEMEAWCQNQGERHD
ncbi:MAG TPA: hypothetical protein DCS29_02380 [Candidatus Magasanikbacteria bacterium]|nr:hypothetical protein [Candidatus Magasanikbacteria bacterium]